MITYILVIEKEMLNLILEQLLAR